MAKAKQYVVTGAYVVVKTGTPQGATYVGLYAGAPWPEDAEEDATRHHLDNHLIEEVATAEVPSPVAPPEPPAEPPRAAPAKQAGGRA